MWESEVRSLDLSLCKIRYTCFASMIGCCCQPLRRQVADVWGMPLGPLPSDGATK
jgi:hypothetical protein